MNPGEELDAKYDKYVAQVAEDEKDNIIIKNGRPHLRVGPPSESGHCFFDHRFWNYTPTGVFSSKRHLLCPASEDYRDEQETHSG